MPPFPPTPPSPSPPSRTRQLLRERVGTRGLVVDLFLSPDGGEERRFGDVRQLGGVGQAGTGGGRVLVRLRGVLGRGGLPRVR